MTEQGESEQFTPVDDFQSPETNEQYVAGDKYTFYMEDRKLTKLVGKWLSEGKIKLVPFSHAIGRIE